MIFLSASAASTPSTLALNSTRSLARCRNPVSHHRFPASRFSAESHTSTLPSTTFSPSLSFTRDSGPVAKDLKESIRGVVACFAHGGAHERQVTGFAEGVAIPKEYETTSRIDDTQNHHAQTGPIRELENPGDSRINGDWRRHCTGVGGGLGSWGLGLRLFAGSMLVGAALALSVPSRAAAQSRKDGVENSGSAVAASSAVQSHTSAADSSQNAGGSKDGEVTSNEGEGSKDDAQKQAAALEMLEGFLAKHPDDVDALKMLLRVRMKSADFQGGLRVLESLIRIQPTEREWRFLRAQVLEFSGDLKGARSAFQAILEQEPLSARALQGLASIMRQSGEDSLVLGMVEEAIARAEEEDRTADVTNLKLLLGQLHAMQGNIGEAVAQYDEVLNAHPRDFRPYLCKGLVLSLAGESEQAEKLFKEFRERCPKAYAPYLDNVIVRSSVEARRLLLEEKAAQAQGNKERPARPMKQPKNTET